MFCPRHCNRWKSHKFRSNPAGPSGFPHGTKRSGRILARECGSTQDIGRYHGLSEGWTGTPSMEMPMEIASSTSRVPLKCFLFRGSRIFQMSDYPGNAELGAPRLPDQLSSNWTGVARGTTTGLFPPGARVPPGRWGSEATDNKKKSHVNKIIISNVNKGNEESRLRGTGGTADGKAREDLALGGTPE